MKKIAIAVLLLAAATSLNAQQIKPVPDVKLNDGLQNTFKPNEWQSPQALLMQPAAKPTLNTITVYSTMPVAKLTKSNIDRMPVVVPGDPNVKYTMLIKKVEIVNPLKPADNEQPKP